MKRSDAMRAMLCVLSAATLVLASCATEEQKPAGQAPVEGKPGAPQPVQTQPVKPVETPKAGAASPFAALKDPKSILSKRSVYFDFDKFEVKAEYRPLVEAHAKFLRDNPSAKMLIQGNADERGSREYNVGLGQRRSDAVKKMLTLLGAREDQIEAVSLGEEKPACSEHSEECWAKNRRDDMLYSGEY
ncbi:MAG TPA: peptidoglycan-associated lipoprotein Pal [Burkholderiales bacterium]|nr:peptidoglycan-associated lipoprotein Pal [Burkholderiales bacterium]